MVIVGFGFKGRQGIITRFEGAGLLLVYIGYTVYLITGIITRVS